MGFHTFQPTVSPKAKAAIQSPIQHFDDGERRALTGHKEAQAVTENQIPSPAENKRELTDNQISPPPENKNTQALAGNKNAQALAGNKRELGWVMEEFEFFEKISGSMSLFHTFHPTGYPTRHPTHQPTHNPTRHPTHHPSHHPTAQHISTQTSGSKSEQGGVGYAADIKASKGSGSASTTKSGSRKSETKSVKKAKSSKKSNGSTASESDESGYAAGIIFGPNFE